MYLDVYGNYIESVDHFFICTKNVLYILNKGYNYSVTWEMGFEIFGIVFLKMAKTLICYTSGNVQNALDGFQLLIHGEMESKLPRF